MRKSVKIGGILAIVILLFGGACIGLLLYPSVLFSGSVDYKNFRVYYESVLDPQRVHSVLDNVDAALATSEINDSTITHAIFLGHGNRPFQLTQDATWKLLLGGIKPLTYNRSVPPHISQIISFRIPDFERDLLLHPAAGLDMGMTHDFIHEAVHTLVTARLGAAALSLPSWKREGYPEYIAASLRIISDPGYELRNSVGRMLATDLSQMLDRGGDLDSTRLGCQTRSVIQDETGNWRLTCYYASRVLVEYLLDVKGLSFDELMNPSVSGTEMYRDLLVAYETGQL